jgi:hypothetical protein
VKQMKPLWPPILSISLPLLLIGLNATPIGYNFVYVIAALPILLGVWACFGVWALILVIRYTRRRQWLPTISSAMLPLVVLLSGIWHWQFIHACNDGGDILYFVANRSSYLEAVKKTRSDNDLRLIVFDRGGMSWSSRGYVYDESDEIVRDVSERSARWKVQADGTELTCGFYASPFPGHPLFARHWYLASFAC